MSREDQMQIIRNILFDDWNPVGFGPVVLELFHGAGFAGGDGFQDFAREPDEGKNVSRRVVASICGAVLGL